MKSLFKELKKKVFHKKKSKKLKKKVIKIDEKEIEWEEKKYELHEKYQNLVEEAVAKSISVGKRLNKKEEVGYSEIPPHKEHEEKKPLKMIISTDIGSDVDDCLSFLQSLHFPKEDLEILGLITEFGHTGIRQGVAKSILKAYNEECDSGKENGSTNYFKERKREFPIYSGDNEQIWPFRYPQFLWHTGNEGIGCLSNSEINDLKENPFLHNKKEKAAQFLVETVNKYPNQVVILCIGSLLNVAKAFKIDPNLPKLIKRITFMGLGVAKHDQNAPRIYEFGKKYNCPHTNLNVRQDMGASIEVFNSGVQIQCCGHTVTHGFWWEGKTTTNIRKLKTKFKDVEQIGKLLEVWLSYRSSIFFHEINGTCGHDVLTLTESLYPGTFLKYVRGTMIISSQDKTTFVYNPEGNHFIGIDLYWNLWKSKTDNEFCRFVDRTLSSPISKKEINEVLNKINLLKKEKKEENQEKTEENQENQENEEKIEENEEKIEKNEEKIEEKDA